MLDSDVSDEALVLVLEQEQDGVLKIIAYASQAHAALTSLFRTSEPVGQQARYLDLWGEYDMEIVRRPGASHQNSDALSCRP